MAGPKLTTDQKTSLRKELKEQVDAGAKQADIMESLGKKYQVSGQTVRYHLNRLGLAPTNGHRSRRGGRRKARSAGTSDRAFLRQAIAQLSEDELRRALKAKAVQVEYDKLRERERELAREYRVVRAKTRELKRRLRRLTR